VQVVDNMDSLILKLKSWQLFPILLIGSILLNTQIEGNVHLTVALKIVGMVIYFGWMLWLGSELHSLARTDSPGNGFFLFNGYLIIGIFSIGMVMSEGNDFQVEGIAALPFFYLFYAVIYVLRIPAKRIRSIELGRKVSFGDYWGLFFMFIFWPIGVWFIQARVNKLLSEK